MKQQEHNALAEVLSAGHETAYELRDKILAVLNTFTIQKPTPNNYCDCRYSGGEVAEFENNIWLRFIYCPKCGRKL